MFVCVGTGLAARGRQGGQARAAHAHSARPMRQPGSASGCFREREREFVAKHWPAICFQSSKDTDSFVSHNNRHRIVVTLVVVVVVVGAAAAN